MWKFVVLNWCHKHNTVDDNNNMNGNSAQQRDRPSMWTNRRRKSDRVSLVGMRVCQKGKHTKKKPCVKYVYEKFIVKTDESSSKRTNKRTNNQMPHMRSTRCAVCCVSDWPTVHLCVCECQSVSKCVYVS